MNNEMKQYFIKDLEKDLSFKISELKKEQQVFNNLDGLKSLMEDMEQNDEVVVILSKLQTLAEKQIAEEIEVYEEALAELRKIEPETKGMLS